jgi:acetoin utilization deacetylase AcuC-like enzyme
VEYSAWGHPERPERISRTVERLREQTALPITWAKPPEVTEARLERVHSKRLLRQVREPAYDFDGDTPAHPDIDAHARRSVGGALHALQAARAGEEAFSLMRPPGHHATSQRAMGFCYLNSIAIAVLEAVALGAGPVAVFDFDVHHGNGTEEILLDRPQTTYFSVHQYPCYPGTGTEDVGRNCFNYPVAPHTPRADYVRTLERALKRLAGLRPALIAVSAGFDAYAGDPLAQGTLEEDDYYWLGSALRKLGVPSFSVLEGGYSEDLPDLILAYLKGLAGK